MIKYTEHVGEDSPAASLLREWLGRPQGVSQNTEPSALLVSDAVRRCWGAVSWSIGDHNLEVVCVCIVYSVLPLHASRFLALF